MCQGLSFVFIDPPTIKDVMPSVMVVQSGSQVHIPCVTESNPEPEIRWLTPRGKVQSFIISGDVQNTNRTDRM